jgi:predicted AAA+ superfamily ATPase
MLEISKTDIVARLKFDNPWWDTPDEPVEFDAMPRRKYFPLFMDAVKERSVKRAVVLMGPRRVGKTVMVYHAISALLKAGASGKNLLYISLETPLYSGLGLEQLLNLYVDLHQVSRKDEVVVFYDEVQYLRDWEVHLKSLVDSYPDFKFVVTGSAAAALRLKSTESGAGRFSNFILPPMTFAEYLAFINEEQKLIWRDDTTSAGKYHCKDIVRLNEEFLRYLNYGGYPEAIFSKTVQNNPSQYIKSDIIDKVLLRDLPSLYGISDIQELNKLFTVLAYNTGNEVSLEELSKSAGIAKNTIKRYLEYLEAAFLITRVERIDNNAKRFKRAMCFKVYLTNPSMRSALFGNVSDDADGIGNLVETAIFSQWQHSDTINLCYARWATGEVDIVSMNSSSQKPLWATEIKWTDRAVKDYSLLRHCVEFAQRNSDLMQPILCTTLTVAESTTYQGVDFEFAPASLHAYRLGMNLLANKSLFTTIGIPKTLAAARKAAAKNATTGKPAKKTKA